MLNPLTTPPVKIAVAVAVVPLGGALMVTVGAVVPYDAPPLTSVRLDTVPVPLILAVAMALIWGV